MSGSPTLPASRPLKTRSKSAAACCSPSSWRSGKPPPAKPPLRLTSWSSAEDRPESNWPALSPRSARHALAHEFRSIDPARTHILLIEGGPRILPAYAEDLSRSAQEQLNQLGVEVRTSTMVTQIEPGAVYRGKHAASRNSHPVGRRSRSLPARQESGRRRRSRRTRAGAARPQPSRSS